jgi:hypothetical protein
MRGFALCAYGLMPPAAAVGTRAQPNVRKRLEAIDDAP